jgi:hypothetical protein
MSTRTASSESAYPLREPPATEPTEHALRDHADRGPEDAL